MVPILKSVEAIIISDAEGKRIFAKYYNDLPFDKQNALEKEIFLKTRKASGEILLLGNYIILYRNNIDIFFYLLADKNANELMLLNIFETFYDSLSAALNGLLDRNTLLCNASTLFLTVDEIIDNGIFYESDVDKIVDRIAIKPSDESLVEQSLTQAFYSAREQITRSFLG